jgi:hypothetical protein
MPESRPGILRKILPLFAGALLATAAGTLYRLFSWKGKPDR